MKFNLNLLKGSSPIGIAIIAIATVGRGVNAYVDFKKTIEVDKLIKKVEIMTQNGKEVEDL